MRLDHNGMYLWYGTADAPAPIETVQAGAKVSVTAGVRPADSSNQVEVLYRINRGDIEAVASEWLWTDPAGGAQYFMAQLPSFPVGDTVEYSVTCRCAGRQIPPPEEENSFRSSFRVTGGEVQPDSSPTSASLPPEAAPAIGFDTDVISAEIASRAEVPLAKRLPVPATEEPAPLNPPAVNKSQEVIGRLMREGTESPLATFTVRAVDLDAANGSQDIGSYRTDEEGRFALVYTSLLDGRTDGAGRRLALHILNPEGDEIHRADVLIAPDQEQVVEVHVPVQETPEPSPPTLAELASSLSLNLDPTLLSSLADRGIRTLADIRANGGITHIEGLPAAAENSAARALEAHADLSVLSTDPQVNAHLIDGGYTNPALIARTPRDRFVAEVTPTLAEADAERIYGLALREYRLLNHAIAGNIINAGNLNLENILQPPPARHCLCEDCQSAVSPSAYLADLMDYALTHLQFYWPGFPYPQPVNLQYLIDLLYQPLDKLPLSCGASQDQVRQVRLCIEVLRKYLLEQTDLLSNNPAAAYPIKFAFAGDVDGDGRDEVIVAPDWSATAVEELPARQESSALWVMDYNPDAKIWQHLSPIMAHAYEADVVCGRYPYAAKFGFAADVDGDGRDEIVIAIDHELSGGNDFWVMDYDPGLKQWRHLTPISGHPLNADLDASGADVTARFALGADVDGDGRAEVIIALDSSGAEGRLFWVMDYDPATGQWRHLSPILNHALNADLDPHADDPASLIEAAFVVSGDFDGDGRAELAINLRNPNSSSTGRFFWVLDYNPNPAPGQWTHLRYNQGDIAGSAYDLPVPTPARFGTALDVDGDGRDELVIGIEDKLGEDANKLWVVDYDPTSMGDPWQDIGTIDCSGKPTHAQAAIAVNSDGVAPLEIAVLPIFERGSPDRSNPKNGLWIMQRDPATGQWRHQSAIANHPLEADLDWSKTTYPAQSMFRADVDGDGRDEIVIYPAPRQSLWVMQYNAGTNTWQHLSPAVNLARAESQHLWATYRMLLNRLGTSFEELRLARTAEDAEREALAERMGITLTGPRPDNLDALLLDQTTLTEPQLEALFGLMDTTRDPFASAPESKLKQWRSAHLRQTWLEQDGLSDAYARRELPVIDSDVVNPDDFRVFEPATAGTAAALWLKRRQWIDARLNALRSKTKSVPIGGQNIAVPDLDAMLNALRQDPITYDAHQQVVWNALGAIVDLDTLHDDITDQDKTKADIARKFVEDQLCLALDGLTRLLEIRKKEQAWVPSQAKGEVKEEEWEEIYSILAQAIKLPFYPTWMQEESTWENQAIQLKQLFSPKHFWLSLREPREGVWSPAIETPYIDPEIVTLNELPDSTVGTEAIKLWQQRLTDLSNSNRDLQLAYKNNGLAGLLTQTFGQSPSSQTWAQELKQLKDDLDSGDPARSAPAQQFISKQLFLSLDQFSRLINLKAKLDANRDPTKPEWTEVYALLTTALKQRTLYPKWKTDETSIGLSYWNALKARLPRWRAAPEARQAWLQALAVRSRAPIIDPDVITLDHVRSDAAGTRQIYTERYAALITRRNLLKNETKSLAGFKAMLLLDDSVGVKDDELEDVIKQREDGDSAAGRLNQLDITPDAFAFLARIYRLLKNNEQVLDDEWDSVYDILTQVWKRRQFADWRAQEIAAKLTHSPDYFQPPQRDPSVFPPPPPPELPAWRATRRALRDWIDTLQSRIDQDAAVKEGLRSLVAEVETATLPMLRDALVMASTAPGSALNDKADWLSERLLIDTQVDGCQLTTRTAQAIETIQALLWSARTGQLEGLDLDLYAPDFDDEWKWIGSYATWRAVMFVYLYPENLLQPGLRRWQTPGFRGLLGELRANRALTAKSAREIARNYTNYFRDVVNLIPAVCAMADSAIFEDSQGSQSGSMHRLAFMFATGLKSGKPYWSTLDTQAANPGYEQQFWKPLDPIKQRIVSLVGAVAYRPTVQQRYLYLFVQTQELGQQNLGFVRYNLEDGGWDADVTSLELPDQAKQYTAWVRRSINEQAPPSLAIQLSKQITYTRQLNLKGNDWAKEGFVRLPTQGTWQRLTDGSSRPNNTDVTAGADPTIPVRYLLAGDVDRDGQDELVVGIGLNGGPGSGAWVWKYVNQVWSSLPILRFPVPTRSAAFAVSGDFDGDGRDEVAAAVNPADDPGRGDNFWVRRYDGSAWNSLGIIQNDPIGASFITSGGLTRAKFAVVGDFDGDARDEIAIALEERIGIPPLGDSFNAFVVMDYENGQWTNTKRSTNSLTLQDQLLNVSFRCSSEPVKANFAVAGDFDGDGRDEIAIAVSARQNDMSAGNDFWVMDFRDNTWMPLGAVLGYPLRTVFDLSGGKETTAFAVAGDFDGDGRDEIAIAPYVGNTASSFWVMKFNPGPFADPARDGSWAPMPGFNLGAAPFNAVTPAVFAVAADLDGDGQDEIAIVPLFNADSRGNDLWIAKYDKATSSWMALPILDCSPTAQAAALAVAGNFDSTQRGQAPAAQLAIAPGATSDVIPSDAGGSNLYHHYQGAASGNHLWVRGFNEVADARQPYCSYPNVAPFYRGAFPLIDKPLESTVNTRRLESEDSWKANATTRRTNLTYIEEYFYSVPVAIALQLQRSGEYTAALDWFRMVYDYTAPLKQRKTYYGLTQEEQIQTPDYPERAADWLLDPLNPHLIASTRRNTYTRFTLLSLVDCFLDYADAEFTRDTAESIARARILYTTALELLNLPELRQGDDQCQALIGWIERSFDFSHEVPIEWQPVALRLMADLRAVNNAPVLEAVLTEARAVRAREMPWDRALPHLQRLLVHKQSEVAEQPAPTLAQLVAERPLEIARGQRAMLAQPVDGRTVGVSSQPIVGTRSFPDWVPSHSEWVPTITYTFCVAPNPLPNALRLRAELNLFKIRTCRNIAGMERELEPYAAPTDTHTGLPTIGAGGQLVLPGTTVLRPTPYRYAILIERAKQLVGLAQQVESAFLSALQQRDQEAYTLLKARQDVRLARAGVRLQDLRVTEAESGVELAELQRQSAEIRSETYQVWIDTGLLQLEQDMIGWYGSLAGYQIASVHGQAALTSMSMPAQFYANYLATAAYQATNVLKAAADTLAVIAQANINVLGIKVGFERRKQEWELQKKLADQDILIGNQQIHVAENHVRVVGQERVIAEMGAENAEATVDFLNNKFTNIELYDWMSDVLEGVYRFFLQQASSLAQLASHQLAFERHEMPPPFIQSDYWQAPSEDGGSYGTNGRGPDRRGLTGPARLLQDIYQLDQYAFETNRRKLQLSKTISLAQLSPVEFQRFRETGVLRFATPMQMFDRDFPGHYLRLIHKTRVSVIALIPPSQGIRATLTTAGLSRVVIGGDIFQTVLVRREPQVVALSSPLNATGLFELDPQSDMVAPFETMGVDTAWEFRMPKAANGFDYSTIADVLLTIEYTALNSFDYRQQVIQLLDTGLSAEQAFSFRNQFADQWYDLHNPELLDESRQMVVSFNSVQQDFPPNLESLKVQHVVLYFARLNGSSFEIPVTHLRFAEQKSTGTVGGSATSIDGIISTRRGNAGSWASMIGKLPFGNWELALPNTEEMKDRFKNEQIEDILFVITYSGRTPEWPQ